MMSTLGVLKTCPTFFTHFLLLLIIAPLMFLALGSNVYYYLLQIIIKDVWKEYTGWPLNDMERQYKFMVKHVGLWSVAFHGTSPKWIHRSYLSALAAYYAKYMLTLYICHFSSYPLNIIRCIYILYN